MYYHRRAISPIISTMIITAATLVLVIGILSYSNNLFQTQTASAEYTQAQNIFVNFADEIDGVSAREGASAYVRINSRSGGPSWISNIDNMTVTINIIGQAANQNYTVLRGNVSALRYKAGMQVGTGPVTILRGVTYSAIVNNQYPLGLVFTNQSNGAIVQLDYDRVGIVDLGYQNVSTGISPYTNHAAHTLFDYVDFLQLNLINLTFGGVHGGATYIAASNTNFTVTYYRISYDRAALPYNSTYQVLVNVSRTASPTYPLVDTYKLNITQGYVNDTDLGAVCIGQACTPQVGATVQPMPVDLVIAVLQPQVNVTFLG